MNQLVHNGFRKPMLDLESAARCFESGDSDSLDMRGQLAFVTGL